MDPSSNNKNSNDDGWGAMGGNPGDGIMGGGAGMGAGVGGAGVGPIGVGGGGGLQPNNNNPYGGMITPTAGTMPYGRQSPQLQQQQAGGSITRFATPAMMQQQPTPGQDGNFYQQQQQPTMMMPNQQQQQYAAQSMSPHQQYGNPAPPGSYAARSNQAYTAGQQQQQQQQSYAARSTMMQQGQIPQQQQFSPGPNAGQGGGYFASATIAQPPPPQQQPQLKPPPPTPPTPQGSVVNHQPAGAGGGSSYSARSVQAHTHAVTQHHQANLGGNMPHQQQQQPQPYPSSASSYAARSVQGGAGYNNPQQQQPNNMMASQQQASMVGGGGGYAPSSASVAPTVGGASTTTMGGATTMGGGMLMAESPQAQALQQRLLTDATRKAQEHAYYMRQAMEQRNLPVVLDRAAHMVGELGGLPQGSSSSQQQGGSPFNTGASAKLTPKNYYELYMRALEEMPTLEDYLYNLASSASYTQLVAANDAAAGNNAAATAAAIPSSSLFMYDLYQSVQYCPRVLSRLYLQISAASALLRCNLDTNDKTSPIVLNGIGAKFILTDLIESVKCEQNPIRGLFLRHFLLTVLRDKLPDIPDGTTPAAAAASTQEAGGETIATEASGELKKVEGGVVLGQPVGDSPMVGPMQENGNVRDSTDFVLKNFMEMNKLWVRIQHLPGEGKNKEVKKRRERERNELRILVGTNLVRLSQLECVTSKIYGEVILPQILEHIVTCGDPLSQAYLMDCLVQVFPDEYHIETLPILLNVCPRLRDKVNIRTILQGLMDRLANYLADEELLDESDTNQVKKALARDSFGLFEECVQNVYNARGPKLTSKEVIRLQTALAQFSVKCYAGNMEQLSRCLGVCVSALRQANASYEAQEGTVVNMPEDPNTIKDLDEISVGELEKLLSIPLDTLALKVLELDHYNELIVFLPWSHRRKVAITLLEAVDSAGSAPKTVKEISELFQVISPLVLSEHNNGGAPGPSFQQQQLAQTTSMMAGLGVTPSMQQPNNFGGGMMMPLQSWKEIHKENALVSKLIHILNHEDTDVAYEMLSVARTQISHGGAERTRQTLVAVIFAALRLVRQIRQEAKAGRKGSGKTDGAESKMDEAESTTPEPAAESTTPEPAAESAAETEEPKEEEEGKDVEATQEAAENGVEDDKATKDGGDPKPTDDSDATPVAEPSSQKKEVVKKISCRSVFIFVQETITMLAKTGADIGVKIYLEVAQTADAMAIDEEKEATDGTDFAPIAYELLSQAFSLYEEGITNSKSQQNCVEAIIATLLAFQSLSKEEYESLITKTAQFAAKVVKKQDQCHLVALCAYLFYPVGGTGQKEYSNPQRALECLQRSLKLADACTSTNASNVRLFVDLLEHYVFFFEKGNPSVTQAYISGLVALIKEHISSQGMNGNEAAVSDAKSHFLAVIRSIKRKKVEEETREMFAQVEIENVAL